MIQLQVLCFILSTKDASFIISNNLTIEFFSDYKNEFNYINNHINTYGQVPDIDTFLAQFPDFDLINVAETPKYLIDAIYEDRNRRVLASTFNKMRDLLNAGKTNEALDYYATNSSVAVKARHIESVDILKDTAKRYDDYLDKCNNFNNFFIKTGLKELDSLIGGWDRKEELACIVARTNSGKSWLLLKFATAAVEQGLRVGVYSGEMSVNKVAYRVDTLISHISNTCLTKGNRDVQNKYKLFLDDLPNKYTGCLRVLTPDMIGGPAGVNDLRAFIERDKLDLLCVDQHSLLEDDRRAKNPVEKAANISKDLKNLQVMSGIPILAVSQQNRNSTENGQGTEHIAQSDRIGQDATIVLFFEQKDGTVTMNLVKSRDSANGKHIKYAADFDKGTFVYVPEENNELQGQGAAELEKEFEDEDCEVF